MKYLISVFILFFALSATIIAQERITDEEQARSIF